MSHQKRRNVLCASSDTAHSRSEVVNMKSNQLIVGTRVIVRPKDGRKIRGTVRWVGQLPLEGTTVHVQEEVPVYGIETVSYIVPYMKYGEMNNAMLIKGCKQLYF